MMTEEEQGILLELAVSLHESVRQMCAMQAELHKATNRLYRLEQRLDGLQEINRLWDGS